MVGGLKLVGIFLHIFVACLGAATYTSDAPCSDTFGVCTAKSELLSVLSEHSSTDHLSHVQIKAKKAEQDPENPLEKQLEKATAEDGYKREPKDKYTAPPEDDFGGTWKQVEEEQAEKEEYVTGKTPVESAYVPLEWAYEAKAGGVKGPSQWGDLPDSSCAAEGQSPIDVKMENTRIHPEFTVHDLELVKETTPCDMTTGYVLNAHTMVRLYEGNCSTTFKAIWKEKVFHMISFHYSSPSEHTIDGEYYPMEVHHVHKAADDDQKLVIAVAFATLKNDEGFNSQDKVAAFFMNSMFDHMPHAEDEHKNRYERHFSTEMWDPYQEVLKGHLGNGFWHYMGSTTTPPCELNTIWMVDPVPIRLPVELVGKYRRMINAVKVNGLATFGSITGGDPHAVPTWADNSGMDENGWNQKLGCNNRPTQPMDGRTLWGINVSLPVLTTAEPLPGDAELSSGTK